MNKLIFILILALILGGCSKDAKIVTQNEPLIPKENNHPVSLVNQQKAVSEVVTTQAKQVVKKVEGVKIIPAVNYYKVVKVVDGDTIDVSLAGKTERIRLIGINTPESVDPRRPVECFGIEASNMAKKLLSGQEVVIEADQSQDNRDKYGRLLRYVKTKAGLFYNLEIIKLGFAHEYTYIVPYKYQAEFKLAQKTAQNKKLGLWADGACGQKNITSSVKSIAASSPVDSKCNIKGNINTKKEKIYHLLGCPSYNQTVIDTNVGEKWFCSEAEAVQAGWRKAGGC